MVRIVSGGEPQDAGLAFLSGYNNSTQIRRQAEEERRRQIGTMLEIQQTKMRLDAEKAKALADVNARAQLGDVRAMQQQDMERVAAGLPPEMQRLGEYARLRQSLTDPKAIQLLDTTFHAQEGKIQAEKKYQAAESEIQRAATDGVIDEAELENYKQALLEKRQSQAPPDDLLKEVAAKRVDRSAKATAMKENAPFIEQMQRAAASLPPGRERDLAMQAATEYELSKSRQQEKGSGAKVLGEIQRIAVGSEKRYDELKQGRIDMAAARPAPGLPGMTAGERNKEMLKEPHTRPLMPFEKRGAGGGPEVPPLKGIGTHKTVKGGAGRNPDLGAIRKVLPALLKETTTPDELVARLGDQGVALTAEVLAEVRKALKGAATNARAQGGADR